MIVNDSEAAKRLASPLNLINRLAAAKKNTKAREAMSIFIKPSASLDKREDKRVEIEQTEETTLDNILENHESKIRLGLAHDSALKLLGDSISHLSAKLDDVKADKLPAAIMAASKVVESIRKERNEANKNNKDREVHYHFYTPEQKKVSEYEVIEVS